MLHSRQAYFLSHIAKQIAHLVHELVRTHIESFIVLRRKPS